MTKGELLPTLQALWRVGSRGILACYLKGFVLESLILRSRSSKIEMCFEVRLEELGFQLWSFRGLSRTLLESARAAGL